MNQKMCNKCGNVTTLETAFCPNCGSNEFSAVNYANNGQQYDQSQYGQYAGQQYASEMFTLPN